ncbi:MAG: hypothetical protein A3J62_03995 [Candidatus Buchananbacteria bacterium RIFCSPHIGHO2_02_FULL_38_8]|uniref:Uncharacterized protein n=1 Tax=Candidatus Buchananbacteria bacterium RIFCSPHIGHO2_02_FULL_38_8 TaxID=1797538 RepID=A0A1G1Y5U9_9BACT|nr:MAG: hypothetical protein A3J62_03995 [Candidatus Buchananbacteria bacterium RIFCSPHIGHO2_02_FULL_38_8]
MLRILRSILKEKKYAIIAIVSALVTGIISYYLTVVNVYQKSIFVYADMNGTLFTVTSLFLGTIIIILVGFYLALVIFRRDIIKIKDIRSKTVGLGGVIGGALASGCPSCGAPLLGLVGFPLALFSLPFQGLELKALSIIFLLLAIYLISKNIKTNLICELKDKL